MKTTFTYINRVFLDNKKNILDGVFIKDNYFDPMWIYMDLEKVSEEIFIQQLETSPIEIQFSFISQGASTVFQKFLGSNPIISSLISTFSNIENANIELNGSVMNNVYGDLMQISNFIIDLYKQAFLTQLMRIFGAIDIFGNPANLLNNLGSGFKDFFQKPYQGIVKGPLEGAKGIMDGSISLVKHTVEGTFSSTSKIAGGISQGILYITQDHDYINDRQRKKISEKPKNFIEGIGYGISSMAGGIYHGVTDIVTKPYEGAKKEKWAGFGKGIIKGLAGVVLKPISGVLELVSKTTEGIKNTVVKDQIFKMERLPRTFYGKFKYVKLLLILTHFKIKRSFTYLNFP
jgi:vacuolar protein sorting-associated protein 13A/C